MPETLRNKAGANNGLHPETEWGSRQQAATQAVCSCIGLCNAVCGAVRLARNVFHGMVWYQAKLEKKQAFLFRTVDIAMELAVMVATVVRTQKLLDENRPEAAEAVKVTENFCRNTQYFVERCFRELWDNHDADKYRLGVDVLEGSCDWLTAELEDAGTQDDTLTAAAK